MAAAQRRLAELGLTSARPTHLQLSAADEIVRRVPECDAELTQSADEAWANVFLAANTAEHHAGPAAATETHPRLALLQRAPNTLYASVRERGEMAAVGAVSFAFGLACVHGMRTRAERRGRGLARHALGALVRAALQRGCSRVFLQVESDNQAALALYQRAGFSSLWEYSYWRRP